MWAEKELRLVIIFVLMASCLKAKYYYGDCVKLNDNVTGVCHSFQGVVSTGSAMPSRGKMCHRQGVFNVSVRIKPGFIMGRDGLK